MTGDFETNWVDRAVMADAAYGGPDKDISHAGRRKWRQIQFDPAERCSSPRMAGRAPGAYEMSLSGVSHGGLLASSTFRFARRCASRVMSGHSEMAMVE